MHKSYSLVMSGIMLAMLAAAPAGAASLLGGLINTGADSGNSGGIVSIHSGAVGVGGSDGVSVNVGGLLGGGNGGGLLGGNGGSVGVPGVAEISAGSSSHGGSQIGVSVLGGGSGGLSGNPLGLLGSGGGLDVSLPGLGGSRTTPGTPGRPGAPGAAGQNGVNGYFGHTTTPGVAIPANASSRLRSILAMLAQRDWIRMVNGRAICLAGFGTAEVSSRLPQRDWAGLNAALPRYAEDIATLRQLLANCRTPAQRQALSLRDLNRVIGIDVARDGTPVLYLL